MAFQNILPKKRDELPRTPAELKKKNKKTDKQLDSRDCK